MRSKEQSEKANLKSNIQNTKITAPSPITSWQIEGEKVEAMMDFPFLGSKITEDSDCSHEIKRCLLLGRKAVINLDSVLKSKDFTLLTSQHIHWNIFIGKTDAESEALILWPPDANSQLIGKDPDAGKD